jgi:NACHT domain
MGPVSPLQWIRWFERALRKLGLASDALALALAWVCVKNVSFSRGGALSGVVRIMRGERPPGLADRNAWGTGVVTLALLCFGAAGTVWLASRSHGPETDGVVTALIGLPTLYLAFATFREGRRRAVRTEAAGVNLEQVADEIAAAVRNQWRAEAQARRLNDPYPLPVRWIAAEPSLVDSWDGLRTLAESGAGWQPRSGDWAADPADLDGEGNQLVGRLARVPTGRLVVLGEPGAGKTMLMVRLILDLYEQRENGAPVPMLMPVASWDPMTQDLREWLELRLAIDHPGLGGPAPVGSSAVTRAGALLDAGLVMLILDGLDEIPDALRGPAIGRINDAVRPGEGLVVTCRTAPFRAAVRATNGPMITVRGAAGVELCPLHVNAVTDYLRQDARDADGQDRWKDVINSLGTSAPIASVLSNPLMISLARVIYNPRPGEHSGTLPDPAKLCVFRDKEQVEQHLFKAFIPAAYRSRSVRQVFRPWSARKAEQWLIYLAHHLEDTIGAPDFAWWQLVRAVPGVAAGLAAGLVAAIVAGSVVWVIAGLIYGLAVAAVALILVSVKAFEERPPLGGFKYRSPGAGSLAAGLICAAILTLALGVAADTTDGKDAGIATAISVGLASVLLVVTAAGLKVVPFDLTAAAAPRTILARDRLTVIAIGVSGGLASATIIALFAGFLSGRVVASLMMGLVSFLAVGIVITMTRGAWASWGLTRIWLAIRGRLPWRLTAFLADAHERGVLRQAGAVYQFRHAELQQRLGSRRVL